MDKDPFLSHFHTQPFSLGTSEWVIFWAFFQKKFIDLLACARHSCGPHAHEVPLFYPNCKWHFKSTPRYTYFDSRVVFFFFFILEESRFHSCIYAKGNENICPREICWIFITALFVTLPNGNNPHVHKPWMNTCKAYNMAYLYNGLLLGHEKERRTDTSHSMDECGNYATRKKTVDSINITSRRENPTETERKLVVA